MKKIKSIVTTTALAVACMEWMGGCSKAPQTEWHIERCDEYYVVCGFGNHPHAWFTNEAQAIEGVHFYVTNGIDSTRMIPEPNPIYEKMLKDAK